MCWGCGRSDKGSGQMTVIRCQCSQVSNNQIFTPRTKTRPWGPRTCESPKSNRKSPSATLRAGFRLATPAQGYGQ